jgi:FkbM family methyltransferase
MILTKAKLGVKKLFGAFGLEIGIRRPADSTPRASMKGALRHLAKLGFRPPTVIDVGVANATAELYEQFADANILLIEPLKEFEPFLRQICTSYRAQYVLAAAGSKSGSAILNVHENGFGSSLLNEVDGGTVDGTPREVPMVMIDTVVAEKKLTGPYLLKVDVQGAELQVLEGAERVLQETEVVVMEVSLIGTLVGCPQLFEVVEWMKGAGFVVYDIWGLLYRPLDDALCQADLVFVREKGVFRASHGYATPQQRRVQDRISKEMLENWARDLR